MNGSKMEKYSVLMSVYEKEHPEYFRQAMDSMINQSVKPDEIVLVEDGPLTEELYAVVKEYEEKYPGLLHIVMNENNLGQGIAFNRGLLECKNELIAHMDTDDIAVIDRCEKQLLFFDANPDVAVLGGQIEEFIMSKEQIIGKRVVPERDQDIKKYMGKRCPLNHVTVMYKRQAVLAAGNYQDWFCNEDYYLWIRMAKIGCIFANLPETLAFVRVNDSSYARRGGKDYFQSEYRIQKLLLHNNVIGRVRFLINISERMLIQRLLPNKARALFFKWLARSH